MFGQLLLVASVNRIGNFESIVVTIDVSLNFGKTFYVFTNNVTVVFCMGKSKNKCVYV